MLMILTLKASKQDIPDAAMLSAKIPTIDSNPNITTFYILSRRSKPKLPPHNLTITNPRTLRRIPPISTLLFLTFLHPRIMHHPLLIILTITLGPPLNRASRILTRLQRLFLSRSKLLECSGTGLNVIGGFTSLEVWTSGNARRLIAVGIWSCGTCRGASFRDGDGSEAGIETLRGDETVRVGRFVRLRRIGHCDDKRGTWASCW